MLTLVKLDQLCHPYLNIYLGKSVGGVTWVTRLPSVPPTSNPARAKTLILSAYWLVSLWLRLHPRGEYCDSEGCSSLGRGSWHCMGGAGVQSSATVVVSTSS